MQKSNLEKWLQQIFFNDSDGVSFSAERNWNSLKDSCSKVERKNKENVNCDRPQVSSEDDSVLIEVWSDVPAEVLHQQNVAAMAFLQGNNEQNSVLDEVGLDWRLKLSVSRF